MSYRESVLSSKGWRVYAGRGGSHQRVKSPDLGKNQESHDGQLRGVMESRLRLKLMSEWRKQREIAVSNFKAASP